MAQCLDARHKLDATIIREVHKQWSENNIDVLDVQAWSPEDKTTYSASA